MAESSGRSDGEEDDDYMGDLSRFLPPDQASIPSAPSSKTDSISKAQKLPPSKGKLKNKSWQDQLRIKRERKQIEEDEKMLEKIEAPIPQSNIGFKLLKQMGYTPGSVLGKEGSGRAEPVGIEIRRSRAGIGREDPVKEKMRIEEMVAEKKRKLEKAVEKVVMEEFGSRQKVQWRSRRVAVNYEKAKRALEHLENKPVEVKNEEDEEGDEEEEEEITEEDLIDMLMKLREQHLYCLFCGCQYESAEALLSNCPGLDEDEH